MFSIHPRTTVQTAIQTTAWCAVRLGCNQRNSTAQTQRGTLVSMSARCLNQTSWSSLLRPLWRNLMPCNPVTLPTEKWEALRGTTHRTALATFGKRSSISHDWFEAKSTVMTHIIEAKWAALAEYKRTPSERNLQILRIARSKAQQTAWRSTNGYWTEPNENIQSAAITGIIRGMYDGITKTLRPTLNKTAPLRSSSGEVITVRGHQLERWVEHYSDIYSRENIVSPSALDAVECRPTMEELDTEPTLEELSKAIDSLASGKAPGSDGIPPDLIKCCKTALLHSLHVLLCQCWQEGAVPQDMWDAKIITLFKNKGERSDCNDYRGISLPSVIGSLCKGRLDPTTEAGRTCLSCIIVWLLVWKVNNRHGLLPSC